MTAFLAALLALLPAQPGHFPLPRDPLQRVAERAIRGQFGPLRDWQRDGYQQALLTGATVQGRAWVTGYYPWECGSNRTHSGRKPSLRSAAVQQKDFHRLVYRYIWTEAYGLRVIEDSGANRNTRVARHRGASIWCDYYWTTRHDRNPVTRYAVFGDSRKH